MGRILLLRHSPRMLRSHLVSPSEVGFWSLPQVQRPSIARTSSLIKDVTLSFRTVSAVDWHYPRGSPLSHDATTANRVAFELSFNDVETFNAFSSSPTYIDVIRPDE